MIVNSKKGIQATHRMDYNKHSKVAEVDNTQETKTDSEGFMEVPEGEELPFE